LVEEVSVHIEILPQPNDVTCGPTSLHAVYRHFGYEIPLHQLISEIEFLEEGGTLAVFLGLDALKRGFEATIYSYNLQIFDPTWVDLSMSELREKLHQEYLVKRKVKLRTAIKAYIRFIDNGGMISSKDLRVGIFEDYFNNNIPVLSGVSATYLYQCKREYTNSEDKSVFDDLLGEPMGHFVVLYGFNSQREFMVADPDNTNPIAKNHYYLVERHRLIHSILLGIITYDSNMLVIQPKKP